ncbi:MAG: DUF692 domain-containing protein [Candidatus Tectimicrobiota bacterium]
MSSRLMPPQLGVGIGLRAPHVAEISATHPSIDWLEVHAENYMGGGPALAALQRLRELYPLSMHGVGLSLGSAEPLDTRHLRRLKELLTMLEPALVSEHLAWSVSGGTYLNHLLPLPYTEETLEIVVQHVAQTQDVLQRRLLVENPSSYLRLAYSTLSEAEFLREMVRRTDCGLLCDVNNVYVSCENLGGDPVAYLEALPASHIGEIHLAGHAENDADGQRILIDDHGAPVAEAVWALYEQALRRFGQVATLIEWDTQIPALSVLLQEAHRATCIRQAVLEATHADAA